VLLTIARYCVRFRVKLGSASRGLRVASSLANRIRNGDILDSLDVRVGWTTGYPQSSGSRSTASAACTSRAISILIGSERREFNPL
jgi:hypothetical protein